MDVSFSGFLRRETDGIKGRLTDKYDWKLALTATADGSRKIHITALLDQPGIDLPPWDDEGYRSSVADAGYKTQWVGTIDLGADGWSGLMVDLEGWRMEMTGKTTEPGHIALNGNIREMPVRFRSEKP